MDQNSPRRGLSRRHILRGSAVGLTAAAAGSFAAPAILAQQPRTLRIAYIMAQGGAADRSANDFARLVAERSEGAMQVQTFAGGQLGGERDMTESVELGSIEVGYFGSYLIGNIVPEWGQVLDVPYLLRDQDHFRRVVDGPLSQPMYDALLQRKGARHVAWCNRGPRHLTCNKAVTTPDDVRGLRLRVPELETFLAAWEMLGAIVTPMAFPEVFLALRQGIIDGQENPLELIYTSSFHEAQTHCNLTGHIRSGYHIVVSERWFQRLDAREQEIVLESLHDMAALEDQYQAEDEDQLEQSLRDAGMIFHEADLESFAAALTELPRRFEANWADGFYDAVVNA